MANLNRFGETGDHFDLQFTFVHDWVLQGGLSERILPLDIFPKTLSLGLCMKKGG